MRLARAIKGRWIPSLFARTGGCRTFITTARLVDSSSSPYSSVDIARFRDEAFSPGRPWFFKGTRGSSGKDSSFPALLKWFDGDGKASSLAPGPAHAAFSSYMGQFAHHIFPYELTIPQHPEEDDGSVDPIQRFISWLLSGSDPVNMNTMLSGILQGAIQPPAGSGPSFSLFQAPLLLLLRAVEFNQSQDDIILKQLYIAQSPLSDLPAHLQRDLPTPRLVREAGKGDVYNSSVWMGLEPTYTPLHRDPNPNLFCQLLSDKTVRLLSPQAGDRAFRRVQAQLGRPANSRIRGTEMMQGPERVALNAIVWGSDASGDILEARLGPGDALFIPTGWWHSVKSTHTDGRLNVSANWWFR
ncbi:Clavaminate synthase-like protein [Sodiomyces alkalinus F11]|uniref:Clavaminate synthase-like protein n=1 Tax=Sodiomyces alkalinus (strain CBS 110278 / VKM F-3762 / F11) TaxID=1314773 RepID=A0A3N2Q9A1_SODAK|nr:Clavaminate synthase-like protein [Sodiomyces alkalinus F11]ROT43330.1 Clavaminate synthase-like protein [Sodiomyces alkalinus F11]